MEMLLAALPTGFLVFVLLLVWVPGSGLFQSLRKSFKYHEKFMDSITQEFNVQSVTLKGDGWRYGKEYVVSYCPSLEIQRAFPGVQEAERRGIATAILRRGFVKGGKLTVVAQCNWTGKGSSLIGRIFGVVHEYTFGETSIVADGIEHASKSARTGYDYGFLDLKVLPSPLQQHLRN